MRSMVKVGDLRIAAIAETFLREGGRAFPDLHDATGGQPVRKFKFETDDAGAPRTIRIRADAAR